MIPLFRKTRKKMADDNKPLKYLRYAIGEIVLVVIGILIALSINNWNEDRKSKIMADEVYTNLLISLEQDAIEAQRIKALLTKSLETHKKLILGDSDTYATEMNPHELDTLIGDILFGVWSFFPKTGVYDLITSNNSLDLLQSNKIKSLLINLYDFQYKRYENVDAIIDNKYHYYLAPVIRKKMGYVGGLHSEVEFEKSMQMNPILFQEHYAALVSESRDVYGVLYTGTNYLIQIEASIHELTQLIKEELNN